MRREGRQHEMVRIYGILPSPWNPRLESRFINKLDSAPTAGLFARASAKAFSNHSTEFTGKCGKPRCSECHMHPCCKSRDKAKGSHKLRSNDVMSNLRLISWRVMDGLPCLNFHGFSATGILNHLDDVIDDGVDDDLITSIESSSHATDTGIEIQGIGENDGEVNEDDDRTSFCEVGFLLEGWCLVADRDC